jgi:TRAP-type C4-dicarboxylate transport system substrate-binding protein
MGGALGSIMEQLELVSSGAVDVIALHTDQYAQRLPLHQILNTEQFVTREKALENITALRSKIPETKKLLDEEAVRNNIKILSWHVQGVTGLTLGFPAKSLADLKGKKINMIAGFHRKVFKDYGWIPVNVQIPELYGALSRGVIDGIFMATAAVIPLKWYEVGKSHLIMGNNQVLSQAITLNLDTWKRLPEDLQQAFIEASRETAEWAIGADKHHVEDTYKKFEAQGIPMTNLTDQEYKQFWTTFSKPSTENYLQNAKNRKVKAQAKKINEYYELMKWGKWQP